MRTVLIANRGEVAVRIAATARDLGLGAVMICSEADRDGYHIRSAEAALCVRSYLDGDAVIAAARRSGADAIHPGYGFLAENGDFAEQVQAAGLTWVGPPPAAIRAMALKDEAKRRMAAAGVPVLPGWSAAAADTPVDAEEVAAAVGFPLLIKPVAGGGGKGMSAVHGPERLNDALETAHRTALSAFGDGRLMAERLVVRPRHVEIQIFADSHGGVVHLFERDCSVQRRHQKVIEEAPAPGLDPGLRAAMGQAAVAAAKAVGYVGAGTVEFLVEGDGPEARFWFMEMNTRLQVEHRVTEAITGQDLVAWQFRIAQGEPLPVTQDDLEVAGHAIEVRLYAEAPERGFLPSAGQITRFVMPSGPGVVVDPGVAAGDRIGADYDPMIAKIVVHGQSRPHALSRARAALAATEVAGVETNLRFLAQMLTHPEFVAGAVDTGFVEREIAVLTATPAVRPVEIVAAFVLAERAVRPALPADPWAPAGGWWLNLPMQERRRLTVDGDPVLVEIDADAGGAVAIAVGGDRVRLHGLGMAGDRVRGLIDGVLLSATVLCCLRNAWSVGLPDGWHDVVEGWPPLDRDGAATAAAGIRAPLSGRVMAVPIAAGHPVCQGARLVLVEAMKMEHWLLAPRDGVIDAIFCAPGEQVTEGQELARLAPPGAGTAGL